MENKMLSFSQFTLALLILIACFLALIGANCLEHELHVR
jgi:disulfide bond formation protein DsbB